MEGLKNEAAMEGTMDVSFDSVVGPGGRQVGMHQIGPGVKKTTEPRREAPMLSHAFLPNLRKIKPLLTSRYSS